MNSKMLAWEQHSSKSSKTLQLFYMLSLCPLQTVTYCSMDFTNVGPEKEAIWNAENCTGRSFRRWVGRSLSSVAVVRRRSSPSSSVGRSCRRSVSRPVWNAKHHLLKFENRTTDHVVKFYMTLASGDLPRLQTARADPPRLQTAPVFFQYPSS